MAKKLYAHEEGAGIPVVLISGLGGLADFWKPVVNQLKHDYRVITFDHPGVGQSEIAGAPCIPGIEDALLRLLDEKGIESAHILGHSTGSLVAQSMALDHPKRVKSIVLSCGWAKPDKRFKDFFAYRQYLLMKLGGSAYNALTRLVAYPSTWYGEHFATEHPLDFEESSSLDVEMTYARMEMLLNFNRRDELASLKLPTWVIGAKDDYIIPFHHSQELASLIPGASLVELSGGHFPPVTCTQYYSLLLRQFWESLA
ncbi:alpha/beta fold hydrolase [Pseudomonas sp. ADAK13]|jgi:aminoacrylate hydrolase|uniref:alpha/beta fold hydrolase n=1 Tax=Pseudomonas sp. ADAK13 TaxID=2730847 RepID=UPI001462FF01|nr:alpha/beta hydrolase [Pseudomonas sp. ADAK13]QJI37883.1 alpha/beta fold hydrolase [Pseudomonas sp. ADAK13]